MQKFTSRNTVKLDNGAHMRAARDRIASAIDDHEHALAHASALGVPNPILDELRASIKTGRVMLARANDLLKRIPSVTK